MYKNVSNHRESVTVVEKKTPTLCGKIEPKYREDK